MLEAIILAGGKGTRLQSVVSDVPKPLASINGTPFLSILMSYLARQGFSRFILSTGFKADLIKNHLGSHFAGIPIAYVHENVPLGTGGAIKVALDKLHADHGFVFNGDSFIEANFHEIETYWQKYWQKNQHALLVATEVADTSRYGRLNTQQNQLIGFSEKGVEGQGLINAGCYVLPKKIFEHIQMPPQFSFESDFLPLYLQQARVEVFVSEGLFIDIGIPADYQLAQQLLKPHIPSQSSF
jgi:D-glycero-alpha-D-manno-heptose 1-phosphate guanylyltransferase